MRSLPRRPLHLAMILAAATAVHAPAAAAQRPDSLPIGVEVRVTPRFSSGKALTGQLLAADSLGLTVGRLRRPPMQLPYGDIASVDVARGSSRSPGGAARGAWRGFLVGATIGIVATGAAHVYDVRSNEEGFFPASLVVGVMGAGLTAVTTVTGAIIGNRPRTDWERVWTGR